MTLIVFKNSLIVMLGKLPFNTFFSLDDQKFQQLADFIAPYLKNNQTL